VSILAQAKCTLEAVKPSQNFLSVFPIDQFIYAFRILTWMSYPHWGQCLVGSLTGAVASQRVTEAREGLFWSSHRRGGLAPRCRLIASWGWSRSQGFGCSPIKAVRELGLKRRETVWSLSTVGAGILRGSVPSTRGPGWTNLWCTSCSARGSAG
jgi:hypothetical protein